MESKGIYNVKRSFRSEHEEQSAVIQWAEINLARLPELRWLFAVPNGASLSWKTDRRGKRYSPEAHRLKREGLKPGVPDLILPVPRGSFHGLFIEMKAENGRPSREQSEWLDGMNDYGYLAALAFGFDQAIEVIEKYLSLTPPPLRG